MALLGRLVPVLIGAAAGCAAVLLAQQYDRHHTHTEGPEADRSAADAPQAAPVSEVPQPSEEETVVYPAPRGDDLPNPNPVADTAAKAPLVDGKIDVTQIASAADFADWDEFGCQG